MPDNIGGAGDLRQRISFYQPGGTSDEFGNVTTGFDFRFTVSANVTSRMGGETVQAARLAGRQPVTITVRQSPDTRSIRTDWKAVDDDSGAEYNIRAVADPNLGNVEHGKYIEMMAETGVAV